MALIYRLTVLAYQSGENMKVFEITDNHIKLIQRMYIGYDDFSEFGAPEVDPKRPYGNSCVYSDIAEILEIDFATYVPKNYFSAAEWDEADEDEMYEAAMENDECTSMLHELHKETETVLQIALKTLSFETGYYINEDEYSRSWRKAEESDDIERLIGNDKKLQEKLKRLNNKSLQVEIDHLEQTTQMAVARLAELKGQIQK